MKHNRAPKHQNQQTRFSPKAFLFDVFLCSLGAFGGPEAHFGVFSERMVERKKYLSEAELAELIALTGILPGPSSTQTIVAIGYKTGGTRLALLTMLVWALPAIVFMTMLSFLGNLLSALHLSQNALRYVGPMALAFIALAAWRIGRKVVKDIPALALVAAAAAASLFFRQPWSYPLIFLVAATTSVLYSREKRSSAPVRLKPRWGYLAAFAFFAAGGIALTVLWDNDIVHLFESFYRYGYLVIGGGQVVVPLMHSELVSMRDYMSDSEFLTGFGLVQGLPGPMFSFSAYAGGMAMRSQGTIAQIAGAFTSGLAIFLPGLLLIFFVYPLWNELKKISLIRVALRGITAAAVGLIISAALILGRNIGFSYDSAAVFVICTALLLWKKIPAPFIVLAVIAAGFIIR